MRTVDFYESAQTDTTLDGAAAGSAVDNTGTYSSVTSLHKTKGCWVSGAFVFGAGPTDDGLLKVYKSVDGTVYWNDAALDQTVTKSAGVTVPFTAFRILPADCVSFKILMQSAGATDTPKALVKTRRFWEQSAP